MKKLMMLAAMIGAAQGCVASIAAAWTMKGCVWGKVEAPAECRVTRRVEQNGTREIYEVVNTGKKAVTINRENFGIHFPIENHLAGAGYLDRACVSHVWCGGDETWIVSRRVGGRGPFLNIVALRGAFDDYSLDVDGSVTGNISHRRGVIILHPAPVTLAAGARTAFEFAVYEADTRADAVLPRLPWLIRARADRYSVFTGETVKGRFETTFDWDAAEVKVDGRTVPFTREGRIGRFSLAFDSLGEKTVEVRAGGKRARMRLNVILKPDEILARRARFIAEKQQFSGAGDPHDGAYLIYDNETKKIWCDDKFYDNNAGRERISMGCVVLKALRRKHDEALARSIRRHRAFVERELFDVARAMVFDGVGRDNLNNKFRAYNFPWMAEYYVEWFLWTGEKQCLVNAGRITENYLKLVDGTVQMSPCFDPLRVWRLLRANPTVAPGLDERIKAAFLAHMDRNLANLATIHSAEVSLTCAQLVHKAFTLCQAYLMSGDAKYLAPKERLLEWIAQFRAVTPDFHVNSLDVRYWDLYWFGKMRAYGDSSPQWVTICSVQLADLLAEEFGDRRLADIGDRVRRNMLCLFFPDGFAASSYLVPWRVRQFFSGWHSTDYFDEKTSYGACYDGWANDQDWILYYQ